jgi:hypothetical protein
LGRLVLAVALTAGCSGGGREAETPERMRDELNVFAAAADAEANYRSGRVCVDRRVETDERMGGLSRFDLDSVEARYKGEAEAEPVVPGRSRFLDDRALREFGLDVTIVDACTGSLFLSLVRARFKGRTALVTALESATTDCSYGRVYFRLRQDRGRWTVVERRNSPWSHPVACSDPRALTQPIHFAFGERADGASR